jgi:outer membrane protein OmpA-like peptidoglycan-associated protein
MTRGIIVLAIAGTLAMGTVGYSVAQAQDLPAPRPGTSGDFVMSVPDTVYFGFDLDTLTQEARDILDQQAAWLREHPDVTVDLAGHTDAVGSNAYNQDLGMRRADRVRDYLIAQGINPARLTSVLSYGEERLAVETPRRELLNRRVVTVVTSGMPIAAPRTQCPPPGTSDLAQLDSFGTLRERLIGYVNEALQVQADFRGAWMEEVAELDLHAELTQVSCSIAYGYAGTGTYAERYIDDCACYYDLMVSALSY